MARSVNVTFTWPYFRLQFIDTDAPIPAGGIDTHDAGQRLQGTVTLDIGNDCEYEKANAIIKEATAEWKNGADFVRIWRKFPDI